MVSEVRLLWVNEELLPQDEAAVDPRDHGSTLGDRLLETMRVREGAVVWMERHFSRLRAGAAVIGLFPLPDNEDLACAVARTLAANKITEAAVRLTVSRGVPAHWGLLPNPEAPVTVVVHAQPFAGYPTGLYDQGMRAVISGVACNERSPTVGIKYLGPLPYVVARREAAARGADEALMLNTAGNLACASTANIFLVLGDTLLTPHLASGALPSIVRGLVLSELAPRLALNAAEIEMRSGAFPRADEVFLTNALLGIMSLVEVVDGQRIGTGSPGPVSSSLGAELERSWTRRLEHG
jgi:branched-chain amino acid aminotransferase